jgi:predicted nucleic acid-binding protein
MAFRIFLDADILLDFTLKRESYAIVRQLMEWVVGGRVQVFITAAVVQDVGRALSGVYGPMQAKELLLALLAEVQVIDAGYEMTVNALHSRMDDISDALSYYTALHHRLDYFITRDNDLLKVAIPVLPVCTPEEFLYQNGVEALRPNAN